MHERIELPPGWAEAQRAREDAFWAPFWESLRKDPEKARRYNHGWRNILIANWYRHEDRLWRQEHEEKLRSGARYPQGDAC